MAITGCFPPLSLALSPAGGEGIAFLDGHYCVSIQKHITALKKYGVNE